jgi:hypothetical protein
MARTKNENSKIKVQVYLDPQVVRDIEAEAIALDIPLAVYIRSLIYKARA